MGTKVSLDFMSYHAGLLILMIGSLGTVPSYANVGSKPTIEITNHKDFKLYRQEVDTDFIIEYNVSDLDGDELVTNVYVSYSPRACNEQRIQDWELVGENVQSPFVYKIDAVGNQFFCMEVSDGSHKVYQKPKATLDSYDDGRIVLWLKADENVVHDGGNVSKWGDASGLGNHALQNQLIHQPRIVLDQDQKLAVQFTGLSYFKSPAKYKVRTAILVLRPNSDYDGGKMGQICCDDASGAQINLDARGDQFLVSFDADGKGYQGKYSFGVNGRFGDYESNSEGQPYRDKEKQIITVQLDGDKFVSNQEIGYSQVDGDEQMYSGYVYEILVFDKVVEPHVLDAYRKMLEEKWFVQES